MSTRQWLEHSLSPVLGEFRKEIQLLRRNQLDSLSRTEGDLGYLRNAIAASRRELWRERWMTVALCTALALAAGVIGSWIGPRLSSESRRLQRLGTSLEMTWQAMSPKERQQLEKLLGWSRPSKSDAK